MSIKDLKYLIYIPSFYGTIFFNLFYFFYLLDIIKFDEGCFTAHVIFGLSSFLFIFNTIIFLKYYKIVIEKKFSAVGDLVHDKNIRFIKIIMFLFYGIGFLGGFLYLVGVADFFGGFLNFFLVLFSDSSSEIRANGDAYSDSVGIQLSYFSWIASAITLSLIVTRKISKKYYILFVFNILINLLFIDRTRPIWILITSLLSVLPFIHFKLTNRKILKYFITFSVAIMFIFSLLAIISNKQTDKSNFNSWDLPPEIIGILNYGVSPFAYFNYMIIHEDIEEITLDRTIYPLKKVTSQLGLTKEPSSLINEFYYVPTPTNVGTFLEPFYRDGGYFFVFLGILLHTFVFNIMGLYFLKNKNLFGNYAYSNICFINLFSFFTPKINNFPIWLFFLIGIVAINLNKVKYK